MGKLRRWGFVAVLSVLILTLAACGSDAEDTAEGDGAADEDAQTGDDAQTPAGDDDEAETAGGLEAVCERGAEEGSFTFWASQEAQAAAHVIDTFNETYPDIEVEYLALRDEDAQQRILTAVSAGREIEPNLHTADLPTHASLAQRDLIDMEVDWTSVGIPEDHIHDGLNVARNSRLTLGLAYNTETTSPDDLPDTWEELIDEQYARSVVVDPRGRPLGQLALVWGEEQTLDYVERLVDVVDPLVIEGGTAGMTAVLTGEALVSTGGRADSALELQADGAPIDIHYLDIVPSIDGYQALLVDSEGHRDAAICYRGWLATPEGAEAYESVQFSQNETVPEGLPEDATIALPEAEEEANLVQDVNEKIGQIIESGTR